MSSVNSGGQLLSTQSLPSDRRIKATPLKSFDYIIVTHIDYSKGETRQSFDNININLAKFFYLFDKYLIREKSLNFMKY